MNIVGISMIRNDADIVRPFVRHTLRVLDHLFVIVHCPEDGTGEILKALHAEGLPMTLVLDNEPAFLQGEGVTWLARGAHAALKPDFIFPLDADEFIVPADRGAIESALSALPAGGPAARICLRTFVPTAEDPTDEPNPVRRIRYRSGSQTRVHKVVLTSAFAAHPTPAPDALRYMHLVRNDAYATLARFAEALIRARPGKLDGIRFDHTPAAPAGEPSAAGVTGRRRA